MDIGAHCAVASCNVRDFLPIACKCSNLYCRDHISPDLHSCTEIHEYDPSQSSRLPKLRRCDIEGCNKPSLFAFTTVPERETCDKCRKAYCVDHRYPDTHACVPVEPDNAPSASSSSARALLEKNFGSRLSSSSKAKAPSLSKKKVPTDPVKLAQYQKVQLMKMRHSAVPVDPKDKGVSLPPDQRLTVNVVYEKTEKPFWFRRSMSTGKAVDLLSAQFKAPSSSPAQLLSSDPNGETTTPLRNDLSLAEQVQDGGTLLLLVTTQPE